VQHESLSASASVCLCCGAEVFESHNSSRQKNAAAHSAYSCAHIMLVHSMLTIYDLGLKRRKSVVVEFGVLSTLFERGSRTVDEAGTRPVDCPQPRLTNDKAQKGVCKAQCMMQCIAVIGGHAKTE
jgi:hypothetical protein